MAILEIGFSPDVKIGASGRGSSGARRLSNASAAGESGTRCSAFAFIRLAGIVQTAALKSISRQAAPIVSPVRAAVSMVNSRARAASAGRARSFTKNAGASANASAP